MSNAQQCEIEVMTSYTDLKARLRTAAHDERLSTGALYLDALAAIEELERDAARYRWLRREVSNGHQSSKADVYIRSFAETWESALQILSEDQFDAAIDAAIAKESHE